MEELTQPSPRNKDILTLSPGSKEGTICEQSRLGGCCLRWVNWLGQFLVANLLPVGLVLCIILGVLVPQIGVALNHPVTSYICIIGIFFISGLFLKASDILASLKAVRALTWSLVSILFLSCLMGSGLASLLQFTDNTAQNATNSFSPQDDNNVTSGGAMGLNSLKVGIQLFFIMPCTVSSGVVMVAQLGGNDVLALIITVLSNVIAIFTIGPMLQWRVAAAQGSAVTIDVVNFLLKCLLQILLPLVVGKCCHFVTPVKTFCFAHKKPFKALSVLLLVLIAFVKVSVASEKGLLKLVRFTDVLTVAGMALAIHVLLLLMNGIASFALRLPIGQCKCVIILASQKSLAVAVPVLSFLPDDISEKGLVTVAIIICHLCMILFDSCLISVWLVVQDRTKKPSIVTSESDSDQ